MVICNLIYIVYRERGFNWTSSNIFRIIFQVITELGLWFDHKKKKTF